LKYGVAFSLLALLATGCATPAAELGRAGLGEEDIRRLVAERWSQNLEFEELVGTRLVSIRDIACRRSWPSEPGRTDYLCYFTADVEAGGRMRSMRRSETFGRNEQGQWVIFDVVTG
jgi:hypothetical protein